MNGTEIAGPKQVSQEKQKKKKISISEILSLDLRDEPNEASIDNGEGMLQNGDSDDLHYSPQARRSRSHERLHDRKHRYRVSSGELRRYSGSF